MSYSPRRPQSGFTLIELLTVIAIIGILASIIIPTLGAVQEGVRRNVEASNLRSIGQGALAYAAANDGFLPSPESEKKFSAPDKYRTWMGLLAKSGDMTDPKLYFSKIDKTNAAPQTLPASVLNPDNKSAINPEFATLVPAFEVIGGLRTSDPATTPLAYTRGLTKDGNWDPKMGVYAGWGGHVVFLNGSTQTFQGEIKDKLTSVKEKSTSNILETVPKTSSGKQMFYGPGNGASVIGSVNGNPPTPPAR